MSQQVLIGFPRAAMIQTDAMYLADLCQAPAAGDAIRMIASGDGLSTKGAICVCGDGEVSQDVADAMAQRVKDAGGPDSGYSAGKIDNAGVYTELTAPTPT